LKIKNFKRNPSSLEKLLTPFTSDIMGANALPGVIHLPEESSSEEDMSDRDSDEVREKKE